MAAEFVAPLIQDNPDGWGPCDVPNQFKDMPYQPFSKGDRLGKVGTYVYDYSISMLPISNVHSLGITESWLCMCYFHYLLVLVRFVLG